MADRTSQTPYYYAGERRVALYPDRRVFALQLKQADSEATLPAVRDLIADAEPLGFVARDRLTIFRTDAAPRLVEALRGIAGVALAAPAFSRMPDGGDLILVTPRVLAQFRSDLSPERIAAAIMDLGLRIVEPLAYASPSGFQLEVDPGEDGLAALRAANDLVEQGLVVFAEPDLVQARHFRSGPPDPTAAAFLAAQWHLDATAVRQAWTDTQGDPAIKIAVMDDGLDTGHPEFSAPTASGTPRVSAEWDFAVNIADASPKTYLDSHGTSCAGVAAAAGIGAGGAAPGCRLIAIRIPEMLGSSDEARMFQWAADSGADIISCSFGPVDGLGQIDPLPSATRLAIQYCLRNGRAGKGIPIFWAAGNGSELVSNDGYAANADVMAIAACTAAETQAPYSDFGPEIFACAPSNGALGDPAIFTTDRRGAAGYNPGLPLRGDAQGNYTNSFGGTSAAAPLAAGIAALALSVNPEFTASQLRELLRATADRIGGTSQYGADGHSDRFGYGRLNAARAVAAARNVVPAGAPSPAIIGPVTWSRTAGPPAFQIATGPRPYYVVEIAAAPELFDIDGHGAERTPTNFYGSWSDSPFQTTPTYLLPGAAWAQLSLASRLWYRVGVSASAATYVDYVVSTPDDAGNQAPFLEIVAGVNAPQSAPARPRRSLSELLVRRDDELPSDAWIEGPPRWDVRLGPPVFHLGLATGASCLIEVGNDPDSFQPSRTTRDESRHFTSERIVRTDANWQAYILPLAAWDDLLGSPQLYYRLCAPDGLSTGPLRRLDIANPVAELAGSPGEMPLRADELLWRAARSSTSELEDSTATRESEPAPH